MEEAPENGKKSSHCAHGYAMNELISTAFKSKKNSALLYE
jgi:hypothetical protein